MSADFGGRLRPLGVYAALRSIDDESRGQVLAATIGSIDEGRRGSIVKYLRTATMVMPIMEHTVDLIGGIFGVDGGSALRSDGSFFWRADTADYVEHYGVALPVEFLAHGGASGWSAEPLSRGQADALEDELAEFYASGGDRDLVKGGEM